MESSQKKRKRWSDDETQALLQEAIEMRIFRHIDGKKHKNKDPFTNMLRPLPLLAGWLHTRQLAPYCSCSSLPGALLSSSPKECADGAASPHPNSRLRQMALLVAYHGDKYYGIEHIRNSDFPTIEGALFAALRRSGAVAAGRAAFPPHYSRASRTDRGVSALGQVVSLRMRVWDGVLEDINCHLPADIRVCGMRRVPPRFNAQLLCDDRLYSYTLPTFAFTPMEQAVTQDYRLDASRLSEVRRLFQQYVGSHSFHSFSPGGKPDSPQMTRHIISVDVDEPYLSHGLEFTTVWIRGPSFVLSQIRRMVGLVQAVCRGAGGRHALRAALGHRRLTGTTAPGLGLVLRQARFESIAAAPWNVYGPLRWPGSAAAVAEMEARLLQHIHSTEAEDMVTFRFLDGLLHNRIGAVIEGDSSYRSPIGYAFKLTTEEGADTPNKAEVMKVTPGPTGVSRVTPNPSEVTGVAPDPTEVTEVAHDPAEVTGQSTDSEEVTTVTPDRSEAIVVRSDPSGGSQVRRRGSAV